MLLDADNIPAAAAALAIRDDAELTAAERTAAMFWLNCCNDNFKSSQRFLRRNHTTLAVSRTLEIKLVKFDDTFDKIKAFSRI